VLGRKGAYRGVQYSPDPFYVIDTAYYVVPKTEMDMRWLYYAIQYYKLGEINDGSPIPSTTRSAVYVQDLAVPPLNEQRRIADILGTLDDKIALNRQMNETLQAIAHALFRSWFVDFDPVRAKSEGRNLGLPERLDAQFPGTFEQSERGAIPSGWQVVSLGSLCRRVAMGPFGSDITTDNFVDSGVPVIRGRNLTDGFVDERFVFVSEAKADELRNANAFPGDIVITHRGTLGQVGLIPTESRYSRYVVSQSQMLLSVDPAIATPRYVFELLRSSAGQHALLTNTSQTGVPAIARPTTSVKSIQVLRPTRAVLESFDRLLDPLIALTNCVTGETRTLASLREALLPGLVSGQRNVTAETTFGEGNR
jgi:type I restriction enzyme S subunit